MLKICKDCGTEKEGTEYYGKQNECKDCTKARVKAYRLNNLDKVKEYDRNRPNAKERNEKFKLAQNDRMQDPDYRERINKQRKDWADRNLVKRSAHIICGNAIRDKRLIKKPCEVCGKIKADAHHDDYEKPLEVRWLCRKHHAEHHKTERERERSK